MEQQERWQRIKEIVGIALERDAMLRTAYLDEACSEDSVLREEVESLLSAHAKADILSEHVFKLASVPLAPQFRTIGPYRLEREIGVGGMGQVWLAEQTEPVRRRVALKLIKAGIYDAALLQRFGAERQSLAIMDHPAIAKVFDAGTTSTGQPYFVMEYVDGLPITEYCDKKKLSIRERLQLFLQVCEGVQHAHQKAIIHRDLKPSNILVVEVDGKPTPRIIDFGLAKAITPIVPGETLFTQIGAFLGTPGYMSPEQANPATRDIDTRTDVYSLGVILYELLTGYLPIEAAYWKDKSLDEALRGLREADPLSPSTKVSSNRETSTARAAARSTEPGQLVSVLRGDLDWITLKALEKDRARRYGTPTELAADVERYLSSRPVVARPASAVYRLRKYVRRNRGPVTVVAAGLALLVSFAVVQAVELRRITRERDRANRITEFMTKMFEVSDPSEARGNSVTAREILDRASHDIKTGMARDPELQAQLMISMGKVYINLGLFTQAQSLFEKAIAIRQSMFGLRNRATLEAMDMLGWVLTEQGKYQEAAKIEEQIFPIRKQLFGPEDPDTLSSGLNLASDLSGEGRLADSVKLDQEMVAIRRRLKPEDKDTLIEMSNLAVTLEDLGRYREAEQIYNEVIPILNRTQGPEHPYTIKVRSNLANVYDAEGRLSDAEKMTRELLEVRRRVLGPEHPDTLANTGDVATLLYEEKRYAEAEKLHREVLAMQQHATGPEHPRALVTMNNLANDLIALGQYREAEQLIRQTIEIQRRTLGPEQPDTLFSSISLGAVLRKEGRYAESEKVTRDTLAIQQKLYGVSNPNCAFSVYNLAAIAVARGMHDEAFALLHDALSHGLAPDVSRGLESDLDFNALHADGRFGALVNEAKQHADAFPREQ